MFDGTAYHGWQLQKNSNTVQAEINKALTKLTGEKINANGCGRTDAGVHANEFFCNFKSKTKISNEKIISALNSFLPNDIAVAACYDEEDNFHSSINAVKKEYIYKIHNSKIRNPFYEHYAQYYPFTIDENLLNEAAKFFIGTHDFKGFMASGSSIKSTVRTVCEASVKREGDTVIFTVSGDGFLYNMVRIMAGTLLYIANGKIDINDLPKLIESGKRDGLGPTAEPQGLYLNKVQYSIDN